MFLIIQIIIHDFDPCNIIHVQSALVNTNSGRPTQTVINQNFVLGVQTLFTVYINTTWGPWLCV